MFLVVAVNFTGIAIGSTAIFLSWDVLTVPSIEIQHYVIECDELETEQEWTFLVVETYANIVSLHPDYSYSCRIQVVGNYTFYHFNIPIVVYTDQAGMQN